MNYDPYMTQIHTDGIAVIKEQNLLNTQMLKRRTMEEKFNGQLSNNIHDQSRKENSKKKKKDVYKIKNNK